MLMDTEWLKKALKDLRDVVDTMHLGFKLIFLSVKQFSPETLHLKTKAPIHKTRWSWWQTLHCAHNKTFKTVSVQLN